MNKNLFRSTSETGPLGEWSTSSPYANVIKAAELVVGGAAVGAAGTAGVWSLYKWATRKNFVSDELFELLAEHAKRRQLVLALMEDRSKILGIPTHMVSFPTSEDESKYVHEYWKRALELQKAQVQLRQA